jgi:hypothetical protein
VPGNPADRRSIRARVLTPAGWIVATFHVPARSRFVDQLNRPTEFVRLTDVSLHGREETLPFLALQRKAAILVLPPADETDLLYVPETEPRTRHPASCLMEVGTLHGTLETLKGVRVSDYFLNKQGFVVLEDCRIRLGGLQVHAATEHVESRVIVGTLHVLGISDTHDAAGIAPPD